MNTKGKTRKEERILIKPLILAHYCYFTFAATLGEERKKPLNDKRENKTMEEDCQD